ncbi:hypothetical protein CPC08DRAFT_723312 [Agrocybe pediades]|nr:hypothetical protein CPC08DRAFT_723312 [Agrocybe pediades]
MAFSQRPTKTCSQRCHHTAHTLQSPSNLSRHAHEVRRPNVYHYYSKLGPGENGATRYLEIDVYPSLSMVTLPQTTETFTVPATGSFEFQEAASHYQAIIPGTTYSTIQPTRSGEPVSYEAISDINLNCDLNIQENTGQCVIDGVDSGSMIVETWTGELVPYATITAIESAGRRRVHGANGYAYALSVLLCTIGTLVGSALVIS